MSEWKIKGEPYTYVIRGNNYLDYEYLCPNGEVHRGGKSINYYFNSTEDAEKFIKEWETKMNREEVQKRIENAQRELEEAQKELKKLEEVKPRHGDVILAWGTEKRLIVWDTSKFIALGEWDFNNFATRLTGHALEEVETLYKDGIYKVIGNIFDGYVWKN